MGWKFRQKKPDLKKPGLKIAKKNLTNVLLYYCLHIQYLKFTP